MGMEKHDLLYIRTHPEEYADIRLEVHNEAMVAFEELKKMQWYKDLPTRYYTPEVITEMVSKTEETMYWKKLIDKGLLERPKRCNECPFTEGTINVYGGMGAKCSIAYDVVQVEELVVPIWYRKVVPEWCPLPKFCPTKEGDQNAD